MRFSPPATRWCHVTCSTFKHHKVFNIAATARFCERALAAECRRLGWRAEVAWLPDRFHALVETPARVERAEVGKKLHAAVERIARKAGMEQRVWERDCWCAVLSNGAAVEAVRQRLREISQDPPVIASPGAGD